MTDSVADQMESVRLLRIRVLSTELDVQRQFVIDRGRTQETKASFVLVVVGLVASICSALPARSPTRWFNWARAMVNFSVTGPL